MQQLTSTTATNQEKLALSQSILARTTGESLALDQGLKQAQLANVYSQISDRNERKDIAEKAAALTAETAVLEEMELDEAKAEKALGMIASVQELGNHPGLRSSVGPNGLYRSDFGLSFISGAKSEFKSEVERLANTLTLENMDMLKGPATDKDVEIVAASMSRLKNMDVTEKSYGNELNRILQASQRIASNLGISEEQAKFYYGVDDSDISEVDAFYGIVPEAPASTDVSQYFN